MKSYEGINMAIHYDELMSEYRNKAESFLKKHFDGGYQSYFKDSFSEQNYRYYLGDCLFRLDRGELSQTDFNLELQKVCNQIDGLRPFKEAMFNRKPGEFPVFPNTKLKSLN